MLGGAWLAITLALLVPSIALRQPALFLVTILFFFTGGFARLWASYLFTGVEYERRLSTKRAFHGDTVYMELRVSNRKILPLPWFKLTEEVPEDVAVVAARTEPSHVQRRRLLSTGLSLRWYHRITLRYTLRCDRRGSFEFGPTGLEAGDMFGLFRRFRTLDKNDYLIVYPKVLPLERLGIPSKELFGDIRVRRHLFEDPVRVVSTRDYMAGDPLKRIHWKSTARTGRLQTKVFDPTTTADMALFLDTRTVPPPFWSYVEQLLELGVLTAASIASKATEMDVRVGLYSNQTSRHTDRIIQIPPSGHPDQLIRILEALAQVQPQELLPMHRLVQGHARALPWSTTLVVITAVPTPDLLDTLVHYRRAGRRVALVVPGGEPGARHGIPTYVVSDAVPWDEVEAVALAGGASW